MPANRGRRLLAERKFFDDGDFVAVLLLGASCAIAPDFHWQRVFIDNGKSKLFKEVDVDDQGENFWYAKATGLVESFGDECGADTFTGVRLMDGKGFDFGQVGPNDMESTATYGLAFNFGDDESAEIFVNIGERAEQHLIMFGIEVNEAVNGLCIGDFGISDFHSL